MNEDPPEGRRATKRTDVGYKRPPVEHQFKAGQKPPPRRRQAKETLRGPKLLAKILGEERRLTRGKDVIWLTNGAVLLEVAFQLSEAGAPTVRRVLAGLLLCKEPEQELKEQMPVLIDPNGPSGTYQITRLVKK